MRGSVGHQVNEIFVKSGINRINESRHEAKIAARASGVRGWHETGKALGIHSYKTASAYRAVWRQAMEHTKENFGMKDIEKLSPEHIKSFLQEKIDAGVSLATFRQYAAACEKLESALNMYAEKFSRGNEYNFSAAIHEARQNANGLERFEGSRAYADPRSLIASIRNADFRLAATLQLESGARVREVALIKESQLHGLKKDEITGRAAGVITVKAKGGKEVALKVSQATYKVLADRISAGGGIFKVSYFEYRRALLRAAAATGQRYQGTHGLRWNFAQNRMNEVQRGGHVYEEALVIVAREMGHERADITQHYQR